jgi:hypothetical protein
MEVVGEYVHCFFLIYGTIEIVKSFSLKMFWMCGIHLVFLISTHFESNPKSYYITNQMFVPF